MGNVTLLCCLQVGGNKPCLIDRNVAANNTYNVPHNVKDDCGVAAVRGCHDSRKLTVRKFNVGRETDLLVNGNASKLCVSGDTHIIRSQSLVVKSLFKKIWKYFPEVPMRGYLFFTALIFAFLLPKIVHAQGGYFASGQCPGGYCYYPPSQQSYQPPFSQYGVPNQYGGGCYGSGGFQPQFQYPPAQQSYQFPTFNSYQLPPPIILESRSFAPYSRGGFHLDLSIGRDRRFVYR